MIIKKRRKKHCKKRAKFAAFAIKWKKEKEKKRNIL